MKIGILGGSGFVGNYVINQLLKSHYKINALVREESKNKIENKDSCSLFIGDILENNDIVEDMIKASDVIIYNIGIIRENKSKNITFKSLHYDGVKLTVNLAKKYHIKRFLLMSAIGACIDGTEYQKSKYMGETYLKNNIRNWTIISPSLIFGDSKGKKEFCSELKKNVILTFPCTFVF